MELLHDLRERYRSELAGTRSRATEVIDLLFENAFVTTKSVASRLAITPQGSLNLIRQLEARGWLKELGSVGRGGRTYWVAHEIMAALSDPPVPRQPGTDVVTAS